MINLFIGFDTATAKAQAREEAQKAKRELIVFGEGAEAFERVPSYLVAQGLFSPKLALMLDRPLENSEGREIIKEHIDSFIESEIPVFIIENALSAEDKKLFPKSIKPVEFGKKEKADRLLPFAMSDAFLKGDRKGAWIEFQKLMIGGAQIEEIHGTLSWAVRSALVAAKTAGPDEAGLKPFVYTKSRRVAEKLGVEKVENISRRLVTLYHNARAGGADMALTLERLILEK